MTVSPEDAEPRRGTEGGLNGFLAYLLEFESGIFPSRWQWYRDNYEEPVLRYVEVAAPGVLVRDWHTGQHVLRPVTVRRYFESLGVAELFDAEDPDCLRRMQYRSMNGWGFVGYQLGEAILVSTGHYEPERVTVTLENGSEVTLKRYYLGHVEPHRWAHGTKEVITRDPDSDETVLASDVNCWRGRFTGLDGVRCFEDLLQPQKQGAVMRRIMRANLGTVKQLIGARGLAWADASKRSWSVDGREVRCTESGILAASHLRGAAATARLLVDGTPSSDELGTSIFEYMQMFAGYDVSAL